jgi:ABC-type multidrug transport system ATPase subunit
MVREEKTFNDILSKLEKQNLKILSVNKAEPTLEDVYISLVGRGFEEETTG